MIKAGIIGATGYAGAELVRLLAGHKDVDIVWYGSRSYINDNYANVYRNFCKIVDARCLDDNLGELADQADVIFTATPQGFLASVLTEEILEKTKVIDLSADFRIKDVVGAVLDASKIPGTERNQQWRSFLDHLEDKQISRWPGRA